MDGVEVDTVARGFVPDSEVGRETLISAWSYSSQNILIEEFRRAKILQQVHRQWGRPGLEDFCREVGCEKSSAYNRLRLWRTYGQAIENGDPDMSTRLDNYGLDITHWIASTYDPEPATILDEAEVETLTVRAMVARIHERKEVKAIEEASEAGQSVEVIEAPEEDVPGGEATIEMKRGAIICPFCQAIIEGVTMTNTEGK